jgi:hypothetical protein
MWVLITLIVFFVVWILKGCMIFRWLVHANHCYDRCKVGTETGLEDLSIFELLPSYIIGKVKEIILLHSLLLFCVVLHCFFRVAE